MSKCPVCQTRKGKRFCLINDQRLICSLCCGNTRQADLCQSCEFYQPPRRRYDQLPFFSEQMISQNHALNLYLHSILQQLHNFSTEESIKIIETLLDRYYFQQYESIESPMVAQGVESITHFIQQQLSAVDHEILVNLFVAIRRQLVMMPV